MSGELNGATHTVEVCDRFFAIRLAHLRRAESGEEQLVLVGRTPNLAADHRVERYLICAEGRQKANATPDLVERWPDRYGYDYFTRDNELGISDSCVRATWRAFRMALRILLGRVDLTFHLRAKRRLYQALEALALESLHCPPADAIYTQRDDVDPL